VAAFQVLKAWASPGERENDDQRACGRRLTLKKQSLWAFIHGSNPCREAVYKSLKRRILTRYRKATGTLLELEAQYVAEKTAFADVSLSLNNWMPELKTR
jgi:hypothetical protein